MKNTTSLVMGADANLKRLGSHRIKVGDRKPQE